MPDSHGPQRTSRFVVEFDDDKVAGWQDVTIPSISIEEGTYREGTDPKHERKVAGQISYDDLEMTRGCKRDETIVWDWVKEVTHGQVDGSRREIAIIVLDEEGEAQTRWEFRQCWPKDYDPPDLDSSVDGEVATESITIAYDEMERVE